MVILFGSEILGLIANLVFWDHHMESMNSHLSEFGQQKAELKPGVDIDELISIVLGGLIMLWADLVIFQFYRYIRIAEEQSGQLPLHNQPLKA
ncbi:unnamed protein product, partial [Mesorhabditis spiculigera]